MELVRLIKIVINLLLAALSGMFIGYLFGLEPIGYFASGAATFTLLTVFQPIVDKVFLKL